MTRNYNRSQIYYFNDLTEEQQDQVKNDFCFEDSDCFETCFFKSLFKSPKGIFHETFLPASVFMRTQYNKFTHGIFSDSAFSGYFVTFSKDNSEVVIAYKYF